MNAGGIIKKIPWSCALSIRERPEFTYNPRPSTYPGIYTVKQAILSLRYNTIKG
jgi:hypothetical protein